MRNGLRVVLLGIVTLSMVPPGPIIASSTVASTRLVGGFNDYPASTSGTVYVADDFRNVVDAFPAGVPNPKKIDTITNGVNNPQDLFVDPSGSLYVLNNSSSTLSVPSSVSVYARGKNVPSRRISLPSTSPNADYISVGPDNTIYVAASDAYEHYYIVEYDPGGTVPSRTIDLPFESGPCCNSVAGLALDSSDNLYVNYGVADSCCGFGITVYAPHALQPSANGFTAGQGTAAGALEIVGSRIYIGNTFAVIVGQLPHPRTFAKIPVPRYGGLHFVIDPTANYLYADSYPGVAIVNIATGKIVGSISGIKEPSGIAVDRPAGNSFMGNR